MLNGIVVEMRDCDVDESHERLVLGIRKVDLERRKVTRDFEAGETVRSRNNRVLDLEVKVCPFQKMQIVALVRPQGLEAGVEIVPNEELRTTHQS